MLYKLEDGRPVPFTGRYIKRNRKIYANPTEEQLLDAGYKQLVETEMPESEEGYYYVSAYKIEGDKIVQGWRKCVLESPIDDELDEEE